MTKFVGCIDLHNGQVKQIVGGTLSQEQSDKPVTNFISSKPSSYYSKLYREHKVDGCHVIKLGPNNDMSALEALKESPNFLQVGGGINEANCLEWLKYASKVIVTSWLFDSNASFDMDRLRRMSEKCGPERLVVDLSCRKTSDGRWVVAMNKWQTLTDLELNKETFELLSEYTDEFLIHAADVEGLCNGIDDLLVKKLYEWTSDIEKPLKIVYAGGARSISDLDLVNELSKGKVDLTYGSSLDIFGGELVRFKDCCAWNDSNF